MSTFFLLLIPTLYFLLCPLCALSEDIESFNVEIFVSKKGFLRVEERIAYDFKQAQRHGIVREIPYRYKVGINNYNLRIRITDAADIRGEKVKFKISHEGGSLLVRIGDPEKRVSGSHTYVLGYSVNRAVVSYDDYDELYWNVTGTDWRVPILSSGAKVYFDGDIPPGTRAACYTGYYGSKGSQCSVAVSSSIIEFKTLRPLKAGEGLTIVVGFPKGIIKFPSVLRASVWFIEDNLHWGLPILTIALMGYVWYTRGRDISRSGVVQVRYEPPHNMTPAEAGTLIDERADIEDVTSTVIDLAVRGWLRIEEVETTKFHFFTDRDYKLIRLDKTGGERLKEYERKIMSGIFYVSGDEVMVSDLKNKFFVHLPEIKKSLYRELVKVGYFPSNPEIVRAIYHWTGLAILLAGAFFITSIGAKIAVCISGLMVALFARFMPRKTRAGVRALDEILGFKEFIERVEVDRLKRIAANDPALFERALPFAIVFGLEDKWANVFKDMYLKPPSWYSSPSFQSSFNPSLFVSNIGKSLSVMSKTFESKPRGSGGYSGGSGFGGGGFSGGGFGGGGGVSW